MRRKRSTWMGLSDTSSSRVLISTAIFALPVILANTYEGVRSVDADIRDAATGIGLSGTRVLLQVELPLAGPALVAGLRVLAVSTVSLVTVGGVLGVPSLGMLFIDGFQRGILEEILSGIVLTVALALLLDLMIVLGARIALPWARTPRRKGARA